MIFAEFYGPASLFADVLSSMEERIAAALHARPTDVVVRRVEAESDYPGAEIWVELSSEEQLARHGREIAEQLTALLRARKVDDDVWVLFRIVPLERVFLNGEPRRRGSA
ncbi:MAG: hypothetical protein HW416_756 [Chloroflexi bacterium]|nr:hypothetical protein [Chloroflexota bacterium]